MPALSAMLFGSIFFVFSYIRMVITYIAKYGSTKKVLNPARGQLNGENEYFPVPVRA